MNEPIQTDVPVRLGPTAKAAIAANVEAFLLAQKGWVKSHEILRRFGLVERALRSTRTEPGICTEFAISSTKHGFRHIICCTEAEWQEFKSQQGDHCQTVNNRILTLNRKREMASPAQEVEA